MKVAGVQMDITLMDVERNLARMAEKLREAVAQGAELVVFPESAVSGYCFKSIEEARPYAQTIPGEATRHFEQLCQELNCHCVVGMLELAGEQVFNVAVLIGPAGVLATYRKVHLPFLGVDRYTDYGDRPFAVQTVGDINIGLNICYDASFPEAARCLTLLGADLIVLPTNWPTEARCNADYLPNTRAMENAVYYMAIDRVGTERGVTFVGHSRIVAPNGQTLAEGSKEGEEILYATVDPTWSRYKHLVRIPGESEIHRLADRRPEMYGLLTEPHDLKTPRQCQAES